MTYINHNQKEINMDNSRFKFRAWDKLAKKMLKQLGISFHFMDENGNQSQTLGGAGIGVLAKHPDCYEIMQFTGLLDKNGKEIYEGDIIKHKQYEQGKKESALELNGVVKFNAGAFYINANGRFSNIYLHDIDGNGEVNRCWHGHNNLPNIYEAASDFEIIGNIHSNPELL